MTGRLAERLSEALKTTPLDEPANELTGHQVAGLARSRVRRRRSVACIAGAVTTMVLASGIGLALLISGGRGAVGPIGPPLTTSPTFTNGTPGGQQMGPPPAHPRLTLDWPGGHRPHDGQIDAVVGQPLMLRARLHLVADFPLEWAQLFVTHPNSLTGTWRPGALHRQPAASARLYGVDAHQGQLVSLTWTPTEPGLYRITYIARFSGVAGGSPGTILVRPAG